MAETILVRADASETIGWGHLMRCLALAQAWQDIGGEALFASAFKSPGPELRLRREEMKTVSLAVEPGGAEDARRTIALAQETAARWIVADGYKFGAEYQRAVKDAGLKLLFIDDNGHAACYCADLILNQNIHARAGLYDNREAGTQLLLGTRYALLRREFLRWQGWQREFPQVGRRLLVTLGGGDHENLTAAVVEALRNLGMDDLEAIVVVAESNPHYEELGTAAGTSTVPIRLAKDVTDISELMAWADSAVSAGGSTCWELAFMGLPNLILVLADNQNEVARQLDAAGISISLGRGSEVSVGAISQGVKRLLSKKDLRSAMGTRGRDLVDGKGAARVVEVIRAKKLRLRRAEKDDCKLFWEWASDASVRSAAFSSAPIPWDEHVKWFDRRLRDPNCFIFVAVDDENSPVGQIRFDLQNEREAEIDVSIDQSSRGAGYGSRLIEMGVNALLEITSVQLIHAFIKLDNSGSIGAFRKADFQRSGLKTLGGTAAERYTRTRAKSAVAEVEI